MKNIGIIFSHLPKIYIHHLSLHPCIYYTVYSFHLPVSIGNRWLPVLNLHNVIMFLYANKSKYGSNSKFSLNISFDEFSIFDSHSCWNWSNNLRFNVIFNHVELKFSHSPRYYWNHNYLRGSLHYQSKKTGIDHEEFWYTYINKEWVIVCYLYHLLT